MNDPAKLSENWATVTGSDWDGGNRGHAGAAWWFLSENLKRAESENKGNNNKILHNTVVWLSALRDWKISKCNQLWLTRGREFMVWLLMNSQCKRGNVLPLWCGMARQENMNKQIKCHCLQ